MNDLPPLPYSEPLRLHQIGAGVQHTCATSLGVIDEWACHCVESDLSK